MTSPVHRFDYRRCTACGELSITAVRRLVGGWFFLRCPNCRRLLRVFPTHGRRWMLLMAFVLIVGASIVGAALTDEPVALVVAGVAGCALLYAWEFTMTLRSPLEAVTAEEAREYRRNWAISAVVTLAAIGSVTLAAMRL